MAADGRPGPERLLIVGAGGFGRETAEAVRLLPESWDLVGFLDDDPLLRRESMNGIPVLGSISEIDAFPDVRVVVCIGSPSNPLGKRRVVERMGLPMSRFATVLHPATTLAPSTVLGVGTVVLAAVVTTTAVRIGNHVAIMPASVLTHDDVVEDFATIASGVCLAGNVTIERGAYVGAGALIREGLRIGEEALVGMGAVVTENVPGREVWAGSPARRLRSVE